jgi:hypothetical protein
MHKHRIQIYANQLLLSQWWHDLNNGKAAPPPPVSKASGTKTILFIFTFTRSKIFFNNFRVEKYVQKSQKMKLQKHYLEVSNSFRKEVRAFFRFTAERKNYEFFQTSQKKRLEILRCVVLKKVFSKKRSFSVQKTRPPLPSETILNPSRPGTLCKAVGLLFVMILLKLILPPSLLRSRGAAKK